MLINLKVHKTIDNFLGIRGKFHTTQKMFYLYF